MAKSPRKKVKHGSVFEDFWDSSCKEEFIESVEGICRGNDAGLINLKIKTCDAAEGWGIPFSSARCTVRTVSNKGHALGRVFVKGYNILTDFIKNKTPPRNQQDKESLRILFAYLLDTECQKALIEGVFRASTETQLVEVLAENLFAPLSSSSTYTLDSQAQCKVDDAAWECDSFAEKKCRHYGNTNIGIGNGWHGRLDILMGSSDLGVSVNAKDNSPGGKVFVEVKNYTSRYEIDVRAKDQIIAQTIVHSFFQRKKHEEFQNFVIPGIAVSKDEIVFYFYDSEFDILMQTCPLLMFGGRKLRIKIIISLWLVLNYKYLGTGLTKQMKEHKSGFFQLAEESIDSYKNEVSLGKTIVTVPMLNVYSESVLNWSDEEN